MEKIEELLKKGKMVLDEEGFRALFKRALFAYSVVDLWDNRLDSSNIACKVGNMTLEIITELKEFEKLLSNGFDISWYDLNIPQCRKRLSKGAILFLALVGKEVAHISWVGTTRKTHSDFYSSRIDYKHEASIGGTMTAPKYRRKGIYTWVYSQIFQYLKVKGCSRAVFEINKGNVAPQKAQVVLNSTIWGEGHCIRLLILFNLRWVKHK